MDDDDEVYSCDVCGQEFDTRAAFEGHEAEAHQDPDDDDEAL